jgi:G3E family GTPase
VTQLFSPLTRTFAAEHQPFGRRLRSPRGARVPLVVVTGFLGAGKTTLIRSLLDSPAGAGTLVIVNEFGEVGIDDALLKTGGEATVLMGNGCLCCVLRSDLQKTLMEVLAERARGELPPFQQIILETSGLADPVPILQTLTADRGLASQIHLQAVVTVIDAVLGAATLDETAEARRQVIVADRLILTKTEIAGEAAVSELEASLRALNPGAAITRAQDGRVLPEAILADNTSLTEPVYPPRARGHHTDNVESFAIHFDKPLDWTAIELAIDMLARLRGHDILRAKGLLDVNGCKGPVVVHQVQHLTAKPVELERWPDENRTSRLVFITRGIPRKDIEDLFAIAVRLADGAAVAGVAGASENS